MSAAHEIAALRRELDVARAQLRERTQWMCTCGGTNCEGQEENKRLRAEVESLRLGRLDDPLLAATVGSLRRQHATTLRLLEDAKEYLHELRGEWAWKDKAGVRNTKALADLDATIDRLAAQLAAKAHDEKCEGCEAPATHSDSEGVPLCKACYDELPILPSKVVCDRCGAPQCEWDSDSGSTSCEFCGHEIELPSTEGAEP